MFFSNTPFHAQLMMSLILLAPLACILTLAVSAVWRRERNQGLPPVPLYPGSCFPGAFDWSYTIFFSILTILSALISVYGAGQTDVSKVTAGSMIISTLMQCMLYLPFLVRFISMPRPIAPTLDFGGKLMYVFISLGAIILPFKLLDCLGFFHYVMETTGCPEFQEVVVMFRDGDMGMKLAVAFAAVIMAPICEEVVYRGFVYQMLKQYSGRIAACILSALLFSVIHGALVQSLPLFIFGVVQCILFERTRSVCLPIIVHAIYNAASLLLILCI